MWRRWYIVYLLGGGAFKCMGECIFQFDFLIFNNGDRWWFIYSSELKPVIKLSVVASNILTSINNFTVNFCLNTRILYTDWERERVICRFTSLTQYLFFLCFFVANFTAQPNSFADARIHSRAIQSHYVRKCVSICLHIISVTNLS